MEESHLPVFSPDGLRSESVRDSALIALLTAMGVTLGRALSTSEIVLCCAAALLTVLLRAVPATWMLFALVAIWAGASDSARRATIDEVIVANHERFVEVELEPLRTLPGTRNGYGFRALALTPEAIAGHEILVYGPSSIGPVSPSRSLRVEGFISRDRHGNLTLSTKSRRLVSPGGSVMPPLHPAMLNDRADRLLQSIAARIGSGAANVPVIEAIALGRDENLDSETRIRWRRAGTYHLLVFSGMQIAMAALVVTLLLKPLGSRRIRDLVLTILAFLAPPFAGGAASVTRAGLTLGLWSGSRLVGRPVSIENLYFLSATLRLISRPDDLGSPGFSLTYAAAGGLIFIGKPVAARLSSRLMRGLWYGVAATVATTPFTLHFFGHAAPLGCLVTLAAGPFVTLVLVGSLLPIVLEAVGRHRAAEVALGAIVTIVDLIELLNDTFAAALPTQIYWLSPSAGSISIAVIVAICVIARRPSSPILVALVLLTPLIEAGCSADRLRPHPHLTILDVGQGDAILLHDGKTAVLIDSGGRDGDDAFAQRTLLPQLAALQVARLDLAVISHPDADHCSALPGLLEEIPVHAIWMSERHLEEPCSSKVLRTAARTGTVVIHPRNGVTTSFGAFQLTAVIPRLHYKRSPLNNSSLTIRANVGDRAIFLAGDLEKDGELTLATEQANRLRADILKVPHHGSRSSSTSVFLEAVAPALALISAGTDNGFGHPAPEVVARLHGHNAVVLSSSERGRITVCIAPGEPTRLRTSR